MSDETAKLDANSASYGPPRIPAPLVAAFQERYEILRETGRGASAIVYLARDLKHDRLVAIKTLNPDVGSVAGERFLREIQVSAGMQHPHILPTYDSGVADGRLFFVMPFVDGGSLRQRLDAEPQMPIVEALQCAHDIALALSFAHDQGVIHRDVKPENIMFYHGHACLADFGVARVMQELDMRVTGHGMIVGTPAYMSPEQLTDNGYDGRSDVYSLACVLYEMIAGEHAFSATTPRELLHKRLRTPPEPIHKHRADVPPFVDDLLLRALAASPHARFPDAGAFAEAIEFVIRDLTAPPKRTSAPKRALESVPKHPLAWAGSAVALIALVALAAMAATPLGDAVRGRSNGAGSPGNSRTAHEALRLAQSLELERRVDGDAFRLATARLAANRTQLHGRDSLFADALIALGNSAYPRACASFDRMRASDSLDAMAWYGIGDCLALDSVVVADASSPSRYRFRTSWDGAARAYMRAATIDPSMHRSLPFGTISNLLVTSAIQVRAGRSEASPALAYAAHPSLSGDSVVFIPYTIADFGAARPGVLAPTFSDALQRNRETLLAFARQWSTAVPNNADAYEALATAYEARGEIAVTGDGAEAALARARTLAASDRQKLRLAAVSVRLRLKREDIEGAQSLADSVLRATAGHVVDADDADRLAGLAALVGQLNRAAQLNTIATSEYDASRGIAPPLNAAGSRLLLRAAAGVCDDSLTTLRGDVDRLLDSYAQPSKRAEILHEVTWRSASLSVPCPGAVGARAVADLTERTALERAQRAAGSGDARRARLLLDTAAIVRSVALPGDISLDQTVQQAALRSRLSDTGAAVAELDRVLNALPTLGPWSVREPAQAAAVGRALAFRAELAARRGDPAEARRRAREVLVLWQHADGALAPTLARMRGLASQ
ncbi:MAG TPA: serine/threonine-protein kinase [Gemmatimonadaceae bacterium]|nr:serine/threonine-protein kinase [Gemmatimonadaceae bacterium]